MILGLIGKKVEMTQVFDASGNRVPVSVVEAGPCTVVQKRTTEKDGYSAIQIGFEEKKLSKTLKAETGHFKKAKTTAKKVLGELRMPEEELELYDVGQVLQVTMFQENDYLDVNGVSKGKGFQGVMKRYNFKGARATHGTHEYFRHGGSIGQCADPGKVFKGKKMAGHMGCDTVTQPNLKVVEVLPENNLILIKGSIPGGVNSYVFLTGAKKKPIDEDRTSLLKPETDKPEKEEKAKE